MWKYAQSNAISRATGWPQEEYGSSQKGPDGQGRGAEMSSIGVSTPYGPEHRAAPLRRYGIEAGIGFLYWLVFVIALEPGNLLNAGHIAIGEELMRIVGASVLGAAISPLVLGLVRRFPVEGPSWLRNAALLVSASVIVAAALIFVSCVLAPLILASETRPFLAALREQLIANELLLVFVICVFIGIVHAVRFAADRRQAPVASDAYSSAYLDAMPVKERGSLTMLPLAKVDWIETQGNYLALHAGLNIHLIRETLTGFERKLDPEHFARVHRRMIVAIERIRAMSSLTNGDAMLHLDDGTELRMSRAYRETVRAKFEARANVQSFARST
jgi:hypothetical protein